MKTKKLDIPRYPQKHKRSGISQDIPKMSFQRKMSFFLTKLSHFFPQKLQGYPDVSSCLGYRDFSIFWDHPRNPDLSYIPDNNYMKKDIPTKNVCGAATAVEHAPFVQV